MISDGVLANAANFNAAFESKNKSVVTKTANYTATSSDYWIICDTSGGAFTITLPAAASNIGLILGILKSEASTNLLTIDPNGAETINGYANIKLQSIGDSLLIIANSGGWNILSNYKYGDRWTAVSSTYTVLPTDDIIGCDPSSASFTATLPDLASYRGKKYVFVRTNSGAALDKIVTIAPNGSDTIDGLSSKKLSTFREVLTLYAPLTGTAWVTLSRYIYEAPTNFTPTGTWSTNSTYTGAWNRKGKDLFMNLRVSVSGAPTAADLKFNLPSGLTIDTTQLTAADETTCFGHGVILDSGTAYYKSTVTYTSTTAVFVKVDKTDATYSYLAPVSSTVPMTFASGDSVVVLVGPIPITNWEG